MSFYEFLKNENLFAEFGLPVRFGKMTKLKKIKIFEIALADYKSSCCLHTCLTKPDSFDGYGEMCTTCIIQAQILLYGYLHGFNRKCVSQDRKKGEKSDE